MAETRPSLPTALHPQGMSAKAHGLPHVCIEVRQDLLSSPAGIERWVRLLTRIIRDILAEPQSLQLLAKVAPDA